MASFCFSVDPARRRLHSIEDSYTQHMENRRHYPKRKEDYCHPVRPHPSNVSTTPPAANEVIPIARQPSRSPMASSDISQKDLSETEMRDLCTEYLCIRFEKCLDQGSHYNEDKKGVGWERVFQTKAHGMSNKKIERKISRLDKLYDLQDTKATLSQTLSEQLERTNNELSRGEHLTANHTGTLVQLKQQLKKINRPVVALKHDRASFASQRSRWELDKRNRQERPNKTKTLGTHFHHNLLQACTAHYRRGVLSPDTDREDGGGHVPCQAG